MCKADNENLLRALTIKRGNILEIVPSKQTNVAITSAFSSIPLNNKSNRPLPDNTNTTIAYSSDMLREICLKAKYGQHFKILPFEAICNIRSLKLNNKRWKQRKQARNHFLQYGVTRRNLITAKKEDICPCNFTIATCNVQSLKYKELQE